MVASSIHYNSQKTKEEFNEKIEDLNLIALRKYACPKVSSQKDWYMSCLECKGGCSVGKRVADILDKETEPLDSIFEKAIKERDPINWLLQKGYYTSKGSAINNLNRWKREQGNKKQLSKIEDSKKPISQDEKFEMALKQADPCAWLLEQGYYKDRKIARNKLCVWKKKKREGISTVPYAEKKGKKKTEIMSLLEGDPDINTLAFRCLNASKQDTKTISVSTKLMKWIQNDNFKSIPGIEKFGKVGVLLNLERYAGMTVSEFLAKYEGQDLIALHNQALLESKCPANYKRAQPISKPVSQPPLAESPTENEEDDEVSVEDFLSELEEDLALEEELASEEEEKPEPKPKAEDHIVVSESSDPLLESFKAKYKTFSSKLDALSKEFKETESKMEKLKEAAKLLGYIL